MDTSTHIERVSGSLGANVGLTLLAASAGGYLAPVLPVLTGALAAGRYQQRVSNALEQIEQTLSAHAAEIKNLSDSQFKLLNEVITSVLHTTDEEKIEILKTAAVRVLDASAMEDHEAAVISRILRDISVVEVHFLLKISQYSEIVLMSPSENTESKEGLLVVSSESGEAAILAGMVQLGLIAVVGSGWGGTINYRGMSSVPDLSYVSYQRCE